MDVRGEGGGMYKLTLPVMTMSFTSSAVVLKSAGIADTKDPERKARRRCERCILG